MLVRRGAHIFARGHALKAARPRELRDETSIGIGVRPAQHVVEMDYEQRDSQVVAKRLEQTKKRHRVRASRDGHAETIPG